MNARAKLIRSFSSFHMLLFALIMVLGIVVLVRLGTPVRPSAIGQPIPDLDLKPLLYTDAPATLQDLQGKIVVLHFWGTWCRPCRLEFPEFVKVAQEFSNNPDVRILSISCSSGPETDLQDLAANTDKYLTKIAPNMPTYSDPAAMSRMLIGNMLPSGSLGYPTTILLDRSGNFAQIWEGYSRNGMKELSSAITSYLEPRALRSNLAR